MERQKRRNRASAPSYIHACVARRVCTHTHTHTRTLHARARDGFVRVYTYDGPLLPIVRRVYVSPFLLEIADVSLRVHARAHLYDVRICVHARPITIRNSLADAT